MLGAGVATSTMFLFRSNKVSTGATAAPDVVVEVGAPAQGPSPGPNVNLNDTGGREVGMESLENGEAAAAEVIDCPDSDFVEVDIDEEEVKAPKIPVVQEGLWTPSRFGKLIKCKQWRVLGGNFRFRWDGRLMLGSSTSFFWIALAIYVITAVAIFYCFEVAPFDGWTSIFVMVCAIGTLYNLVAVACSDPGCLPKAPEEVRMQNMIQYQLEKEPGAVNIEKRMTINGKEQLCNFCTTCCHFKPKRTIHCDRCGFCIDRLNCHCWVFGTCIGRRNYGNYCKFLFFVSTLYGTMLFVSLQNIVSNPGFSGLLLRHFVINHPTTIVLLAAFIFPVPLGPILIQFQLNRHLLFVLLDLSPFDRIHLKKGYFDGLKGKTIAEGARWMAANFYRRIIAQPPESLLALRSYVTVRAIPRIKRRRRQTQSSDLRYKRWLCNLPPNTLTPSCGGGGGSGGASTANNARKDESTSRPPCSHTKAAQNLNPFVDEDAPKTRGVYTLPSRCPWTRGDQPPKEKSKFEQLRLQYMPSSHRIPGPRTEAAEPAPSPAQIRQQRYEMEMAASPERSDNV